MERRSVRQHAERKRPRDADGDDQPKPVEQINAETADQAEQQPRRVLTERCDGDG
jgi:hypothetical protein